MGFLISTFKPVGEVRNVIQNQKIYMNSSNYNLYSPIY